MSLRPGDTVEHFVIVSLLGQGGMGQVYVARDTRLQRSVALKIVQPENAAETGESGHSNGAARLLREAQSAAALEHPNVVTIYEVGEIRGEGEEAGRPFIAMELVKGKPLRAFVGNERVPMKERVRWLVDIARALATAHQAGLVHRDIKPENVMVRGDGVVKVLDFGLAKRAASTSNAASSSTEAQVLPSLTGKGVAIGTPYYMAPEQMRNEVLDGRADQFAWGVLAYELLSGTPAWGRDIGALELVSKLLSEDPMPLAELRADVPAHVAAVVARAMEKKRGARFETMDEVIAQLEDPGGAFAPTMPRIAVSSPELPEAPDPPAVEERGRTTVSVRPRRSRPGLLALAGAGVAAVAAVAVLAFVAGGRNTARAPAVASASASAAPVSARECTRSTECVAKLGGKAATCNPAGRCAAIASEDCEARYEPQDLQADDTVWIGSMFPTKGPMAAAFGAMHVNGVDLARKEIAEATRSLSGAQSAQHTRRIALVSCDDSAEPLRAAKHMVDDVGVPAIVGFRSGSEVLDLAGSLLIKSNVVAIASLASNPLITRLPQPPGPRLVWRTTYGLAAIGKAAAGLAHEVLEPRLHRAAPIRVAMLRQESPGVAAFADALYRSLEFNGRSAMANGRDYEEIILDDSAGSLAQAASRVRELRPSLVFALIGDTSAAVRVIEEQWPRGEPRPTYVLVNDTVADLLGFMGASKERRARIFAVSSLSDTPGAARFVIRYNATYGEHLTRETNPGASYDAFYVAAYGVLALGDHAVSGSDVARSLARLIPPSGAAAPAVEVGPMGVLDAVGALAAGRNIDLQGVASDLDFDLGTGEIAADFTLFCAGVDAHGVADQEIESGVVFRAHGEAVVGTWRCP